VTEPVERPCRFCRAAYGDDADLCEFAHKEISDSLDGLATALARAVNEQDPTDEQVGAFMEDAVIVALDFDPRPARWSVTSLGPDDEFSAAFRINRRKYVLDSDEDGGQLVRLSTLRQWQREADRG
jgi:hypothetical protein